VTTETFLWIMVALGSAYLLVEGTRRLTKLQTLSQKNTSGAYSIGSDQWNGLSKLMEEAGEVIQVGGKIIGAGGEEIHFDGSNLRERLIEELGDLQAAVKFVVRENGLDWAAIRERERKKMKLFSKWNAETRS